VTIVVMTAATRSTRRGWRLPAALLALTVVPVTAGMVRLAELATGAEVTPHNARYFDSPVPIVLHIVAVTLFGVLGVFQFVPGIRRRRPGWHRRAGRVLVLSGLGTALTGMWMTIFYDVPEGDGATFGAVYLMRLAVSTGLVVSMVLAFAAIRGRDVVRHRAWMIRGYALAMGAGTQVFTHAPLLLTGTQPTGYARAVAMGAGWLINIVVAEWVIRRGPARASRAPAGRPLAVEQLAR
jgi:hypothetical protein